MAGIIQIGIERIILEGRIWIQGYLKMQVRGTDETALTPATGYVHVYAKTSGTTTKLYYRDDAGTEHEIAVV